MSTFYNPSMMQMYASQGYAPQGGMEAGAGVPQSSYNPGGYTPGSQSNAMVGAGQIEPYMLDTFGYGQYYRPYGVPGMNQSPPPQPYYSVPTEYIPEGTPGLDQQAQQPQQQAARYMRIENPKWGPMGDNWTNTPRYQYIDQSTGQPVDMSDQATVSALKEQFGNLGYQPRPSVFQDPFATGYWERR